MPTDTLYGLVGQALDKKAVARIYKVRRRNPKKPLIILISSFRNLSRFSIKLDVKTKKILENLWPGPISVILSCPQSKFSYLHRGTNSLAFRLPKPQWLRRLIKKTGPLVAPSANPEGFPPAKTIKEAKRYFGSRADFYSGAGKLKSPPSTIISLKHGKIKIIREGAGKNLWLKNKNVLENR